MTLDLELYRRSVQISSEPPINLSVIDIAPELPTNTVVFLHGYGGQARQWEYQLDEFCISNRVIAIDLRGHGQSEKPMGSYSMDQIIKDLELVLDSLQVEGKIHLIGHSFGGAIAAEFASYYPERIIQLILIATAGEFRLHPFYRFLLNLPAPIIRLLTPVVRGWLSAPPHVMYAWYHHNLTSWNGWSLFRSLQVPTIVIRGHQDRVFSKTMFDEVARAIPEADEIDVGASGHLVMLERRDAVNRVIQRSLEFESRPWRSGRLRPDASPRAALIRERPWLAYYDEGVPFTIAIPNIPIHQFLESAAARFPGNTSIIYEGRRISYRKLKDEVFRAAHAFQDIGIEAGDRVMLLLPNVPQMVIAYFAILQIGAVAVFSHPITDKSELIRQLEITKSRALITLESFTQILSSLIKEIDEGGLPKLSDIIVADIAEYFPTLKKMLYRIKVGRKQDFSFAGVSGASVHRFKKLIATHRNGLTDLSISPESLATIQFTGGTTAEPKGVMLSHRNLVANAVQTRHWMPNAEEGKERFLSVLPFSHSYGLTTGLNLPIALGATLILKLRIETTDLLKAINSYRPTVFPGVPSMYMAIKDHPNVRKYGISSIKACISGSAPLPIEVQEAFEKLTRGRLVEGYGLTEAGPATHANPLFGQRKIGSIGIPFPSTEACVVDLVSGKKEVPTGQIGELAIRGPQVMLGYWENQEATENAFNPDGFLLSGDVAQMDSEGYFHIISRKADMWYPDRPGEPAFPRDVEEVLFEIPQVKDAAVVAIANQPIAFIISRKDRPEAKEIIAFCKRRLPPQQVPRKVVFLEEFPRTFIGKILRRELADHFAQSQVEHQRISEETPTSIDEPI